MNFLIELKEIEVIDQPSKNIPGILAESRRNSGPHLAGLVWNSRWIPGGFRVKSTGMRWNPPELLPAFPWYSAGIPDYSVRNSAEIIAGIPPEIRAGIPLELLPAFPRYSTGIPGWNSAGIIAGIPPEFRAGIPPELLPAFPRYSAGIIAGIPPVFHRNYCRHSPRIPPEFRRNYCCHSPGIPPELWAGILPELLPAFPRYSRLEFH